MGINLDYYFEILPMDIQKKYKSNHVTLTGEVCELFSYIQNRINNGSLAELFWENNKQINEKRIQIILENIMDAYFIGKNVDISREVLIKNGQVDFKLFRSNNKDEKILIEVANKFIRENIYTDTFQMYINISILDARKKASQSKRTIKGVK